jgi:hypothetical protein
VSRRKAAPFAYWRRWLLVPAVFGLTILVCMTRLPTYAGFWLSKPWLEGAAREAKADPGSTLPPRVIGVFGRFSDYGISTRTPGQPWFQVLSEGGRTVVLIGYQIALVRQDDGQPPTGPLPPMNRPWRAQRLSANWFLVEPD